MKYVSFNGISKNLHTYIGKYLIELVKSCFCCYTKLGTCDKDVHKVPVDIKKSLITIKRSLKVKINIYVLNYLHT